MQEITQNAFLLSAKGGALRMILDGELLAEIAVPAGRIPARDYLPLLPDGAFFEADGLAVLQPRSLIGAQDFGQVALETGANPDFTPTSATRMEVQMRVMMQEMASRDASREARMRHLESIEHIPRNPDPEPVIESVAPAEPEPAKGV